MPRQISPEEVETVVTDLRRQLDAAERGAISRLECSPESIEQGLAKLVLGLIELLRRLLERQAVRRMEGGSLSEQQIEEMGQALMKLEEKIREIAAAFDLKPEDLNLDLGPLGNLLDR
jgi:Gas vesicle protein K